MPRYPIGIQTFPELIEKGYVYVDKTGLIYNLTHSDFKYVFLSRPRRFGKSLLISTIRAYFEGQRELFAGLEIERLETEWCKYPVLHFSMSRGKHFDEAGLTEYLSRQLMVWEEIYGCDPTDTMVNTRLSSVIRRAYEQTGEKVVVLIDEYDAPLLDVAHEETALPRLRNIMRNFYGPLKDAAPYLRFVLLTGITKFSQVGIFSGLNNIKNISLLDRFAAICGITEQEMTTHMSEGIDSLADELEISRKATLELLKRKYDGYHFSKRCPDIYNPFSLLNCFSDHELGNYWFESGTPTSLIELMRKFDYLPTELGANVSAAETAFDIPIDNLTSVIPLLYQSGYITIKDYDKQGQIYTLGIPNDEVRIGLMQSLMPNYIRTIGSADTVIRQYYMAMKDHDIDSALTLLQTFFKTVPYCNDIDHEGHWQQMLYVIFSLLGARCDVEVHTSHGRVDLVAAIWGKLYLMEIKLDQTAETALSQINLKEYDQRFALYNLPIVKLGVNFSTQERTITDWEVEK